MTSYKVNDTKNDSCSHNNDKNNDKEKEKEKEKEKDIFSLSRASSFLAQKSVNIQLPLFQSKNSKNMPFSASLMTSDSPENVPSASLNDCNTKSIQIRQTDSTFKNEKQDGHLGKKQKKKMQAEFEGERECVCV